MELQEKDPQEKYYLNAVDTISTAIYSHHGLTGELLIPTHSHQKAQLLYTEGGIVNVAVEGKTYFLPARHYLWIPAGVMHSIHPNSVQVTMRNLYFPIEEDDAAFYKQLAVYPANELVYQFILFSKKYQGDVLISDTINFQILKALKLLLAKVNPIDLPLSLPVVNDKRLLQVTNYLANNVQLKFNFKNLAQQFGFSERTLSRLFKVELNMSFIQYLTILRMLKALKLLLDDKLPVNEVAIMVGYNSLPTFSNTFKQLVGMRPSEYVKLAVKLH
jgi:AraC-like DNA-binding protein